MDQRKREKTNVQEFIVDRENWVRFSVKRVDTREIDCVTRILYWYASCELAPVSITQVSQRNALCAGGFSRFPPYSLFLKLPPLFSLSLSTQRARFFRITVVLMGRLTPRVFTGKNSRGERIPLYFSFFIESCILSHTAVALPNKVLFLFFRAF